MKYDFEIIRSARKTVSLEITKEAKVLVRAPQRMKYDDIVAFVEKHGDWIERHLSAARARAEQSGAQPDEAILRRRAAAVIPERVRYWAQVMDLEPAGVRITAAKGRFGSCSGKNSLCFSLYLAAYPMRAVDYVVVHELAHIKHKNHGRDFYALIEKYLPDYREREALLKAGPGEVRDLYDSHRNPTGEIGVRGEALPEERYRVGVTACIFDSFGRVLIQRRADGKRLWPGLWDFSVGGSVGVGESSLEAILREAKEELGVDLPLGAKSAPALTVTGASAFEDCYIVRMDLAPAALTLQTEEVSEVRYATREEVLALADSGRFVPYQRSLIGLLFELNEHPGMFGERK